ncbi:E3 ubiquitin-protein ligase MARCH2-like isoform X2 [Odontomachus brunneus]|uniref:E3 ubiquitin-protein ligase MARCH2-like isoform X2 n=1 Tax=Odontomachus brunneus TaxID=486640 RepID=UPI0013F2660C|nr:E3 ubiquitin-protein ligase MARCH2-like isoform X2 [Odontomachus brunneus]
MSHVENAERSGKNGSGRTNDVEDARDKSVVWTRSESSLDDDGTEVELKTSQILSKATYLDLNLDLNRIDLNTYPDDTKARDNDECVSSGDICRICHMGNYGLITENHSFTLDSRNSSERASTPSNLVYLGSLISACKCRGTVALVHVECLERWLNESGRARCELCGYKYATKRVPRYGLFRSVVIWFHAVIATRQMLLDIGYLVMTTPVAVFSCYVCTLALKTLLRNGFYEIPWMTVAMLPTCLLTLIAYWRWIIMLGRVHGHRWRRYWRNNFVIRLMPSNDADDNVDNANNANNAADDQSNEFVDVHDFEQWMLEEIEEFA